MTPLSQGSTARGRPVLALGMALALGFVLILVVSHEPLRAFRALLSGALPDLSWNAHDGLTVSRLTRFAAVIEDAVTLTLLGLAMMFGLRARQFSMGADGQLFLSALVASWVGVSLSGSPVLATTAAIGAAVLTGFAWGWIPGYMKARWSANEIVTTLMLNALAIQLYRGVITHLYNDPAAGFLATPALSPEVAFAGLWPRTSLTALAWCAPLAALAAWVLLNRSTIGFEIRAVGDSAAFARAAGMPVERTVALSMALGGAFAGLAGAHLSLALLHRLPAELVAGIGFEGLLVALLARNDPRLIPFAALGYAYLKAGGQAMERASDVPREMVLVIQALIVLFVVCDRLLPASAWRRLARLWGRR